MYHYLQPFGIPLIYRLIYIRYLDNISKVMVTQFRSIHKLFVFTFSTSWHYSKRVRVIDDRSMN